jgi:hypothetical protein
MHRNAPVALSLVWAALALTACGGGGASATTSASTTATGATQPARSTPTTAQGSARSRSAARALAGSGGSVGHPAVVLTAEARRGKAAGRRTCAGVKPADALAHFLALAKAAQKQHPIMGREGMIVRIEQLPKAAFHGRAATAFAAALVASGMPAKQRAGGFAGCVTALGGIHTG